MKTTITCSVEEKNGWYEIALVGRWRGHSAGEFELTREDLEQIVRNFVHLGVDVVVDYEHQSLSNQEAPAAGWIRQPDGLKVEGDRLLARIEWTTRAKERIAAKEYRYLSPTLIPDYTDPVTGLSIGWVLHSVALTNTPFLRELPPIANKTKEAKMSKELTEKLQKKEEEITALKAKIETLQKELDEHRKVAASAKVEEAIAAKKIAKEQKEWAIDYALKDPQGFEAFLKNAKPIVTPPPNDQFAASDKPTQSITFDRV